MASEQVEHMVEKANAARDFRCSRSIERQAYRDIGFTRLSLDCGRSHAEPFHQDDILVSVRI